MKMSRPPRFATWLLTYFGPQPSNPALAGDLAESFQQGRSSRWYWRQVLAAIRWRTHLWSLVGGFVINFVLFMYSSGLRHGTLSISGAIEIAGLSILFLSSLYLPLMLSVPWRAVLVLWIIAFFLLLLRFNLAPILFENYYLLIWLCVGNLIFTRKPQLPAFRMTYRELFQGDALAEKRRLLSKLEHSMSQETDPELREAYAEAIAALQSENPKRCSA